MNLTKEELLLAADAAERWPWQRISCLSFLAFDERRTGETEAEHARRCGCPLAVITADRERWQYTIQIGRELHEVFREFPNAIDAGRGREVADAFRAAAEKVGD